MGNVEKEKGLTGCGHQWVTREKKTFSILTRFCSNCGRVEHLSDNLDNETINKIKGE